MPNARADAVRGNEEIGIVDRFVGEMCPNPAVLKQFVADECFIKLYDVVEAVEQNLTNREAINGRAEGRRVRRCDLPGKSDDTQLFQLRRQDGQLTTGLSRSFDYESVEIGRQAVIEPARAACIEMDAVSLAANIRGWIALVDRDIHSGAVKSLRQREATQPSTDDDDPEGTGVDRYSPPECPIRADRRFMVCISDRSDA